MPADDPKRNSGMSALGRHDFGRQSPIILKRCFSRFAIPRFPSLVRGLQGLTAATTELLLRPFLRKQRTRLDDTASLIHSARAKPVFLDEVP
jgi:hypothetical protein